MLRGLAAARLGGMKCYRLHHRHTAAECPAVFASWHGFASPLRHGIATGSCARGGHELWWDVGAESATVALELLPEFVAVRTKATAVDDVPIP